MEYVKDSSDDRNVLEKLQLAVFKFVSLSTDNLVISGTQHEALVSHLVNCAVTAIRFELRQCSRTFLLKIFAQCGILRISPVELNVWLLALKVHPTAVSFFIATCKEIMDSPVAHEEEIQKMFKLNCPCSSLMVAAWKHFDTVPKSESKEVSLYLRAAMCALMLCQFENQQVFAATLLTSIPKKLSTETLKSFLQSWVDGTPLVVGNSELGLSRFATMLLNCVESTQEEWKSELVNCKEDLDELEVTLYQSLSCLAATDSRKAEQLRVLDLVSIMFDQETMRQSHLTGKLLQHPYSLQSFNPINFTGDAFTVKFTTLIRDSLQRMKLDCGYKEKLVQSITQGVASVSKKTNKKAKKEAKKTVAPDQDLLLSIFDLFDLKVDEIEPLIVTIVELEPTASVGWMSLLDFLLMRAAMLRLDGVDQRIQWSIFQQVLQVNIQLKSPELLKKGIVDVISVCPEFLDESGAVDEYRLLLESCLNGEWDATQLCLLLIGDCRDLRSFFVDWCAKNEHHFKNINWRLQILAELDAGDHSIFERLHRDLSPEIITNVLMNQEEYNQVLAKMKNFPKFVHKLIDCCWQPEQCQDLATKLLSQHKNGLSCDQFYHVGRKGTHYELHLKLCLRSAVWLLKNSELSDVSPMEKLADEIDWISKNPLVDKKVLVQMIMADSTWSKFLKYTLRVGLRAQSSAESMLPTSTLRLLIAMLKLLSTSPSQEVLTAAQQVLIAAFHYRLLTRCPVSLGA